MTRKPVDQIPATRREMLDCKISPFLFSLLVSLSVWELAERGGILHHMRIGLTKSCDLFQQDAWKDLENQWRDLPRAA